ncbi:MAG: class I SAM-dependent methyltransferase [Actinomycetota bacterium]
MRPAAADAERRRWSEDRTPVRRALELAFDVDPKGSVTWLTVEGSTGEAASRRIHGIELPFEDGSIDRLVCSEGFQLLAHRGRALEEMRRVLVRGGDIEVAVPGSIEGNPPCADLAISLERHSGTRGAAAIRWLFCMPEPDDLRGALAAGAFEDVRIDVVRTTARSPSIGAFLARSGFFDRRTAAELTHLLRALESRADEHGLHLGSETIVGRARRV